MRATSQVIKSVVTKTPTSDKHACSIRGSLNVNVSGGDMLNREIMIDGERKGMEETTVTHPDPLDDATAGANIIESISIRVMGIIKFCASFSEFTIAPIPQNITE